MAFWEDVKAKVEAAQTVEEGAVEFVRSWCDRLEQAFNANDWNQARALVSEAHATAPEVGQAIAKNTDADKRE